MHSCHHFVLRKERGNKEREDRKEEEEVKRREGREEGQVGRRAHRLGQHGSQGLWAHRVA